MRAKACGSMSSVTSVAGPEDQPALWKAAHSTPVTSNWSLTANPGSDTETDGVINSGGDPAVFMTLADAMALQTELDPSAERVQVARNATSVKSASVAAVIARLHPTADTALLSATVRQWKHVSALTLAEQEQLLLVSVVDKARRQIGLFLIIRLTVSAVVIAHIIYTMTREKLK